MTKIGICYLSIGDKYKTITQWSRRNKISYCNKHGYTFIQDESVYDQSKTIPWSKIPLILKYIDEYDYIVWVDADMLIMNSAIKIESFIDKYSEYDIICGNDWKMINTGFMIIKNSDFSKEFYKAVFNNVYNPSDDKNGRYNNHEQGSFINLHDRNFMDCQARIKVTSPRDMNSYWFNFHPGDFILHFAAVRGELLGWLIRDCFPDRFDYEPDDSYTKRMEWLAGPIRDHWREKAEKENKTFYENKTS
jgi:hypothetical protein